MSEINASAVASLRSRTGVSILECKKALEEAGGDEEKAIEILRSRGEAAAVKKADRDQGEGSVFIGTAGSSAAAVVVHCETDFVARGDDFKALGQEMADLAASEGEDAVKASAETRMPEAVQKLGENISLGTVNRIEAGTVGSYVHTNGKIGVIIGLDGGTEEIAKDVSMHAAAMSPEYVSPEEVPAEAVEKEKEIWAEQLKGEGKPEEIIEKIMVGKEKKFREENALLKQDFVKNPEQTIEAYLDGASVTQYVRVAI